MSRTVITSEKIVEINELYAKYHNYAMVGRELGIASTTVKKYVQADYIPQGERAIITVDIKKCNKIIENYICPKSILGASDALCLTEEEKDNITGLWKEIDV